MKRWLAILPIAALGGLAVLAATQLMNPEKGEFTNDMRDAPDRLFETISGEPINFSDPAPEARIVNLFASWCAPCRAEHPHLMALGATYPSQTYGVLYKDSVANGEAFLEDLGNPFRDIAIDSDGQGGLDFGLTGVPETFVLSKEGEILLHINGPLTDDSVKKIGETLNASRP